MTIIDFATLYVFYYSLTSVLSVLLLKLFIKI